MEILSFLKEVFSVFEKCQFLLALFPFGKKCHFMQKVLVFGQMSQFLCKNVNFGEKNWNFVRNVDFFKQLCTTTESEYLIGKHSNFQKIMTFVWLSIYIKKLSNSDKNFYFFFRKCLFVHVFIFIKVFYLLENCYFDSKYHFIR